MNSYFLLEIIEFLKYRQSVIPGSFWNTYTENLAIHYWGHNLCTWGRSGVGLQDPVVYHWNKYLLLLLLIN